jgi:fructose-1,6-bisphosphatase
VINVCQPGKDLACAGYVLYSSSTVLVLTIGQGVWGFTLDPLVGEFVLTHRCVRKTHRHAFWCAYIHVSMGSDRQRSRRAGAQQHRVL